jgi:AraC-like DNA-binding protein
MYELTDRAVDIARLETSVRTQAPEPTPTHASPSPSTPTPTPTHRKPSPTVAGVIPDDSASQHYLAFTTRLAVLSNWRDRFHALDEFLAERRRAGSEPASQVVRAYDLLSRSDGSMSIGSVAESVGWDQRRLQRAFRAQIGVLPKAAARILRLQHALRLLGTGLSLARVAHECAYFDQSHLTHDITEMTGRSPRRLLAERAAMPPGPPDVDRLSGEIPGIVLDPAATVPSLGLTHTTC